ncbi:hypothetical protein [Bacteroides sp.]|uniref:NADase-type glycan-binding domain-containing protein n=1 Tax=Bacteroides sp. TaxID=29523 RepID=UPI0026311143|nr:hypothetical protein [Bacteroides sp.]MDD3036298.1 hypothetical protein [Bacteroides sp.]
MRVLLFIFLITSCNCWGQNLKELFPKIGETINLSNEGEKKFLQALKSSELIDGKENYWDIIGVSCSFYCACGLGELSASSELKPQHGLSYRAQNAHDLSYRTAWIEGVPGYGAGEYLVYRFPPENPRITDVIIINGYVKSDKAWRENSRVKRLKMYVDGKPYAILNLQDSKDQQIFAVEPIGHSNRTDENLSKMSDIVLKFEIVEVYPGEKYDDTAITEIYFDGIDHH